ncbi:glucose-1-phosphate adenylyltransferase [Pedosphaera parvula]|uniref:Glucose-1-phosphate adenylyltransferase n=1 Tax=Pedosphaera parvula (strain Ellin514) TaxID=320771 RepID=B9XNC7_PEDPL|nr:glucose-1-phosphate adenylyltransferase [Pedosphaera parvula]EEF58680.1 glucose-1-phosphate adenylyltransferase [Pedosphaera parvula Ellin514]
MAQSQWPTPFTTNNVLSVILGGGRGTRLFPLTKDRSKPAVPLGGKYRLVDIPISNCINSGMPRIFLLTQFNSASLHRHISQSYKFDVFSAGFVEILAAEQTLTDTSWYQGTADAVRKNFIHLSNLHFDYLLILSGDQLYRMDYRTIVAQHIASKADVTVSTIPVTRDQVPGFGIMRMDPDFRITEFVEKPKDPAVQDKFRLGQEWYEKLDIHGNQELFLASMGIYVFSRKALFDLVEESLHDFGKDVIPQAIRTHRVCAYVFQGAWEDIGTIRAFFDSNLDLTTLQPRFNIFDMTAPIFTRPRFLPAAKINGGIIEQSLISEGCIITRAKITQSVLGLRSIIGESAQLDRTIVMGSDYYETGNSIKQHEAEGKPRIGIGRNTRIDNAIIDKNARIGDNCTISPVGKAKELDHPLYFIRDGIVIIPKNGLVPHGTTI